MERSFKIATCFAILLGLAGAMIAPAQEPTAEAPAAAAPPADTPAIAAIKESKPTTAGDLVRAALLSLDLGREDLAKAYLQQLIDKNPKQEDAVAAYRQLGSGRLMRLQTEAELQPVGGEAADILFDKLDTYLKDPDRLTTLVSQLTDADRVTRKIAVEQLLKAGPDATNPLFAVLGDPDQESLHAAAKKMLVRLDKDMYEPLVAALASENDLLVAQLADVAKEVRLKAAAQFLVGRLIYTDNDSLRSSIGEYCEVIAAGSKPDAEQVKGYLSRRVKAYLGKGPMFSVDDENMVQLWTWDADTQQVVQNNMPLADAEVITAGRLLEDLHKLEPEDTKVQVQRALATMQTAGTLDPADLDLGGFIDEFGLPVIQEALGLALKDRKFAEGAIVASQTLGSAKDASVLIATDGKLSSLARALQSPIYRIRRAAAKAIVEIDPQQPYAGSSELMDMLAFMATAQGKRVVVIGELDLDRRQSMAGVLAQLGYDAIPTSGGAELFKAAFDSADVEAIFVSKPLSRLPMMEAVQVLRKDRRTGELPIGVIAPIGQLDYYELRTKNDPLTWAMIRPNDQPGYMFQLQQMYKSQGRLLVSAYDRALDAEFAINKLAEMLETPDANSFYDFTKVEDIAVRRLVDDNVTEEVAVLLGNLATPTAQMALLDYASDPFHPLEFRQQCVDAFQDAVAQRGLMLTKEQIVAQYDRYNASEQLDSGTQTVLGKILDIIEAPTQNVRFDQPAKSGS